MAAVSERVLREGNGAAGTEDAPIGLVWLKAGQQEVVSLGLHGASRAARVHQGRERPAGEEPSAVVCFSSAEEDVAPEVGSARALAPDAVVLVFAPSPSLRLARAALGARAGRPPRRRDGPGAGPPGRRRGPPGRDGASQGPTFRVGGRTAPAGPGGPALGTPEGDPRAPSRRLDKRRGRGAPVPLGVDREAAPARGLQGARRAQPQGGGSPLAEVAEGEDVDTAVTREEAGTLAVRGVSGPWTGAMRTSKKAYLLRTRADTSRGWGGGGSPPPRVKMPGVDYVKRGTRRIARKG